MSPKIEAKSAFKVIIGGGSITGLTLANMLQSYDVDFLVLESYPDIAPQVGASIGILPHGQRMLDQSGLHQKINALAPPLDSFHFRDHAGNIICEFRGMVKSMYERSVIHHTCILMDFENWQAWLSDHVSRSTDGSAGPV